MAPNRSSISRLKTFSDLIDLHIADTCEVGKPPRRSKAATLETLKRDLGKERTGRLDRQKLTDYGKMRTEQGAGPVTLGIDIRAITLRSVVFPLPLGPTMASLSPSASVRDGTRSQDPPGR